MKVFIVVLLIVGAVLCFGAKKIAENVLKKTDEKTYILIKLAGFIVVLVSALITFLVQESSYGN